MDPESLEGIMEHLGFKRFQYIFLLICGILHSFDAVEMLILTFLLTTLRCQWHINLWEESFVVTCVFIGMAIGGPIIGRLCDIYGRKVFLIISTSLLGYMGALCAAAPSVYWIIVIRTITGAAIGGVVSSLFSLVSELIPIEKRSYAILIVGTFWPIGSCFTVVFFVAIVPVLGWRVYLIISTLPIVILVPFLFWLPESPRFLLLNDNKTKALWVLNRIATLNKVSPIVNVHQPTYTKPSIKDLFHKNYLITTLLNAFLWFNTGLTYYGIVLIAPIIDQIPRKCLQNMSTYFLPINQTSVLDESCCFPITWSNSLNAIISTSGELVFMPITMLLVNVIGRKNSLVFFTFLIFVSFILMNLCMPPMAMSCLLFIVRGVTHSRLSVNYVYTSEVFPTSVRSVSIGSSNMATRVGAMMSPFIVNFIIKKHSLWLGTLVFTFFNFVAFIVAFLLPYETKNRQLYQTADEKIIETKVWK